jgi:flagellar hook assembly protein FlgD
VLSAQHEFMTRQPGTGGTIINNERTFNTPNPCKTRTSFQYTLNRPVDSVTITVYTLNGSKVVELRGTELYAGTNMLPWDLRDSSGNRIANGLYIYQVKVKAGFVEESVKKTNLIVVH